jgi:hypothetical protein
VDIDHFAAHLLFRCFNIERSGDIANYRGPSMSVGDVVEIDGRAYAVDTAGIARIENFRREQIVPGSRSASTSLALGATIRVLRKERTAQ